MASTLTTPERKRLMAQLAEQLRQDCDEARRLGYRPTQFLAMLSKDGPVAACQRVIMSVKIPDGFMRMIELQRLDLTAEATVLRGPWQALFAEAVLAAARKRLRQYGREDLAVAGPVG